MSFLTSLLPAAAQPAASGDWFSQNFLTIALVLVLAVMVIFMVRNSRKRKRDAEELQNKFVPGAEVMTQHGIYGTLISVDEEKNEAIIETTPGTRLRVHRQTVARVIEPQDIAPEEDVVADEPAPTGEPEYGERIGVDETPEAATKPARAPRSSAASSASTTASTTAAKSTAASKTAAEKSATASKSTASKATAAKAATASKPTASKPAASKATASSAKPRTTTRKPAAGDDSSK